LKNETLAAQIRASMSSAKTSEMKQELKNEIEKQVKNYIENLKAKKRSQHARARNKMETGNRC